MKVVLGGAAAVVVLCVIALGILASGIGDERLRAEAEAAVARLGGDNYRTQIGGTYMSMQDRGRPTLEVRDVRLFSAATGDEAMRVGFVRFGIRLLPLIRGELKVGNVAIGDARIELPAVPQSGSGPGLPIFDSNGLVDPGAAAAVVFDAAKRLIATASRSDVDRIELEDVDIVLFGGDDTGVLRLMSAVLDSSSAGKLSVDSEMRLGNRVATFEGLTSLDPSSGKIETLTARLDWPSAPKLTGSSDTPAAGHQVGSGTIRLAGSQTLSGDRFIISAQLADLQAAIGNGERLSTDVDLAATAQSGTGKVEIESLRVSSGRSTWRFHGAVGPAPSTGEPGDEPFYRFELVSDGSSISPAGSPEPALSVVARIGGRMDSSARLLTFEEIGVRSTQGEVRGNAAVRLEPGKSPGVELQLDVDGMPVGQIKQLWPWFSAPGARNWVVNNIYGGRIETGGLALKVPPGRMGNGVPLGADEVSGRFTIRGTRFDVAGRIPPVRDGNGSVEFRGTDVDIALESGTVYMPGGRTVDASSGTLEIRSAHINPVIGKLRIDIEGAADAVLQLASYDPIDVNRFVDLEPSDLSGKVAGVVAADIPLQRDIPAEDLHWRVELDYEGLDIAKPFEDQIVSAAVGSIAVDPAKAVINAKARLNDAPATLQLVEPLGTSDVARQRKIVLQLDDKARRAIAPGLDALLSGIAEVELDDGSGAKRGIKASLNQATLTIPWVGWSKGNGVAADVSFAMTTSGSRTELSDFHLSGETFGAAGALSFVNGEVINAKFPSARLNRGDDFSFDMKAQGQGYAITVRGKSVDARSVVKLYAQDSSGGTSSGGSVPVVIDLEVDTMTGFHGAVFRNVKLKYSGTGARTDLLEFSAITGNGSPITFSDRRDGNARRVTMQSSDAGSVLRFLDIYERMEGGDISLSLAGSGDGALTGQVDSRNFWLVNEPRLSSLVATAPDQSGRSLNQAVRGEIDTSRVRFERGFAEIEKGTGYLTLDRGVLRGPQIGATYQGTLYDREGNMAMTGTLMPAYGLNRIFGEIPIIGQILGNGRDRGLIGITFRLSGKTSEPQLQVNPLSVIAPGIFRSVFEFR